MTETSPTRADVLLAMINQYIKEHGFSPTLRDLEQLTVSPSLPNGFSRGSIQWQLRRLEREGKITRMQGDTRMTRTIRPV